jgi:hypothetical protein
MAPLALSAPSDGWLAPLMWIKASFLELTEHPGIGS